VNNLDRLLHLVGVLGADAAWLLRGLEGASLDYTFGEDGEPPDGTLALVDDFGPVLFVAHFPDDGSEETSIDEMRLPAGASDREIQAAALLNVALDNLTRIGPHATARVLEWLFQRYGIQPPRYGGPWVVRDRRPKDARPDPAPAVEPEPAPPIDRGQELRRQRLYHGLSQEELASRVGLELVSRAQISLVERGKIDLNAAVWSAIEIALTDIRKERGDDGT
jgi:DNA-binding XRE family transcriptional regulator